MFKNVTIFLITTIVIGVSAVFCYDNINTHPQLSLRAVQVYNDSVVFDKITTEQSKWIEYGAINEDTDPRYVNHFYNPKTGGGLTDNVFFVSSAKVWAQKQTSVTGDYSYQAILNNYRQGDKRRAWQGVGHILHLVQDMSVPAHVRIDDHGTGDPYESWAEHFGSVNGVKNYKVSISSLDQVFDDLAIYTYDNFFSKDTIVNNDKKITTGFLKSEKDINGEDADYVYYNNYKLIKVKSYKSGDEYFIDYNVNQSYWNLLAPKAIGYSAGVIELFAKEFKKIDDQEAARRAGLSWMQRRENELKSLIKPVLTLSELAYNWGDAFMVLRPIVAGEAKAMATALNLTGEAVKTGGELVVDTSKTVGDQAVETGKVLGDKVALASGEVKGVFAEALEEKEPSKIISVSVQDLSKKKTTETIIPDANNIKVKRVIDGDTIELMTGEKVRYIGVDSPELNDAGSADDECLAWVAKVRNEQLINSRDIRLVTDAGANKDGYGRLLRYVYVGNNFVNEKLATEGLAKTLFCQAGWSNCPVMTDTSRKKIISDANASAVKYQRGIYSSVCKSTIEKILSAPVLTLVDESKIEPITQVLAKEASTFIFNSRSSNDRDSVSSGTIVLADINTSQEAEATTTTETASNTPQVVASSTPTEATSTDNLASTTDDVASTTEEDQVDEDDEEQSEEIEFDEIDLVLYDLNTSSEYFTSSTTVGLRVDGISTPVEYYFDTANDDPDDNVIWLSEIPDAFIISDELSAEVYLWLRQDGEILDDSAHGRIFLDYEKPEIIFNQKPGALSESNEAIFNIVCEDNFQEYLDEGGWDEKAVTWTHQLDDGDAVIGLDDEDIVFENLSEGMHVLNIEAIDNALNVSTSSYFWTVDSTMIAPDMQADHIVISEIQIGTSFSSTEEFIELYNPTDETIDLSNYRLTKKTKGGIENNLVSSFKNSALKIIYPKSFYLISREAQFKKGGVFVTEADSVYTVASESIAADNTIILYGDAGVTMIDKVGYGNAVDFEASSSVGILIGSSIERKHLHDSTAESMIGAEIFLGNGYDSNNNYNDFVLRTNPDPQNSGAAEEPRIPHYAQ